MARQIPVALVLNSFDAGGTEYQMTELLCRLDPALFAVHAVCLGDRGALRPRVVDAAIPIVEFPIRGLASTGTAREMWRFARWCRAHGIAVVHSCDFYANVFALPAARAARVPVRIGSRRDVSIPERTRAQSRLQQAAYTLAHRVVANSAAAVDRLRHEGVPAAKVVHIANGLDPCRFSHGCGSPDAAVVTTVANLRPGKGHDVLLAAAALVVARRPDVIFRFAGDGSLREELRQMAAALGVAGNVEFLGHQRDIPAVLRDSRLFAFASFMEASPNAVIEAMAAGLPIAATRVGGIPDVIEHERHGLLVPPGDAPALSQAILRLLEDPALATRLAVAARTSAIARFSFDRMVQEFQTLYLGEMENRSQELGVRS